MFFLQSRVPYDGVILILDFIVKAVFAAIPAIGFGMVFYVPPAALRFCALGGSIGYSSRELLMSLSLPIKLATFIASLLVGIMALLLSKKYFIPQPVYAVASIIPMIPGTCAFTAMITLVDMNSHGVSQELIFLFIENALKAISIVGAISIGLALPSLGNKQSFVKQTLQNEISTETTSLYEDKESANQQFKF